MAGAKFAICTHITSLGYLVLWDMHVGDDLDEIMVMSPQIEWNSVGADQTMCLTCSR